ncbi:PemK-like, MazF-like toxin of type II toxin-antitoxin system [Sanguibacter antarcticus]|uniref:PemK-like, MazF-like toxin of type II toxin-antitoxin system n=1 Tax=Sanguibacter antarcticus TaxID=372484 RepID=A0A2A9E2G9_9MICO|nr:PemK-like, MazF-like toxin of type II toxin-antitoxin system [Sanguibacter antarcticus]
MENAPVRRRYPAHVATTHWKSLLLSAARHALAAALPRERSASTPSPSPRRSRSTGRSNPSPKPRVPSTTTKPQKAASSTGAPPVGADYPGDFDGTLHPQYSPELDGEPDPGEIVWTWVPYEEDHTQGKDRPVLVVGRDGGWLLALMLTSKDHSKDAADEARWGRRWLDIGTGPWDREGRESEIRLDRIIRVDPEKVRREGAIMDRDVFDKVAAEAS